MGNRRLNFFLTTLILFTLFTSSCFLYYSFPNDGTYMFVSDFASYANGLNQKLKCLDGREEVVKKAELPIINADEYEGENDTVKLQAAFDNVPQGGAIVLLSSRVWIAAGLRVKSNTYVMGMAGSILKRPENFLVPFITLINVSNFAIFNLIFDGRSLEKAYGLAIIDCQNFTIQSNTFYNFRESAIKITSINGTSYSFAISDNSFLNCQNVPIHVFGIPARRAIRNFIISNNTLVNGTRNGKIGIAFSANGIICNNKIFNCEHGIATRNVSNVTIINNRIENITNYGIYLGTQVGDHGTDDIKIMNNSICNTRIGISRYYGSYPLTNVIVANNQFVGNRELDILADFPATFINNTITDTAKLKIKDSAVLFLETKTISGKLVLPGDLNDDLKINIKDIIIIAISLGSKKGHAHWDERADIISDGKVDVKDLSFVAKNFGLIITK